MAVVVWPYIAPPIALPPDVLPVEVLPVSDETNIARQDKAPEPEEQPTPPTPEPQPQVFEPPPPPPEPEPEVAIEQEVTPTPPPPPDMKVTPPAPRYAMLPAPRAKPKPEPKKPEFNVADIEKALKQVENQQKKEPPAPSKQADRSMQGAGAQTSMTMSEIDAFKEQLYKCWNVPVGAPDPAALVLRVKVFLNEDGTVATAPQLVDQGNLGDPYFRAAADSAIRAVHMCGPYQMPPAKFATWREITIRFDPREMSGY
jgi:hypothetical protein